MLNKPTIVFTFPNCIGGVASFNYNIINYSSLIDNFYSKVILLKSKEDDRLPFLDVLEVDEVILFEYSNLENQYHVQKRLIRLIGEEKGALVTDNALTLGAITRFDNPKTVFHLIHDFFYVNQNIVYGNSIDIAISHSSFFSDAVFASSPIDFMDRILYIPYGVKQGLFLKNKQSIPQKLNLVFLGRLEHGKGVDHLFEIEQLLQIQQIEVNWTIIGKGSLKNSLVSQWKYKNNIVFHEPDTTDGVYELLEKQDVFIFPTSFEGTPVAILECLANGVVTIVNDLPGGIRDIVTNNIGFRCKLNNLEEFASKVKMLHYDRVLLSQMQSNCFELFKSCYNIKYNSDNYFDVFLQFNSLKREFKIKKNIPVSRLDRKFFPNFIVRLLRRLLW